MRKSLAMLCAALLIAACTGPQVKNAGTVIDREMKDGKVVSESEQRSPYSEYLNKATEQKVAFEMTCPRTGCVLSTLKVYHAPSASGNIAAYVEPETAGVAFVKGTFDFGKAILGAGTSIAPWAVVARGFSAMSALGSRPTDASVHTNIDTSNRSTTNVDASDRSTTTTTTTTTNNTNSNNVTRTCSTSASVGTTGTPTASNTCN